MLCEDVLTIIMIIFLFCFLKRLLSQIIQYLEMCPPLSMYVTFEYHQTHSFSCHFSKQHLKKIVHHLSNLSLFSPNGIHNKSQSEPIFLDILILYPLLLKSFTWLCYIKQTYLIHIVNIIRLVTLMNIGSWFITSDYW
jgi:hypothetical protein